MVIISFPNGTDWYKPSWMSRQLQRDVVEMFPDQTDVNFEMEKGEAIGTLFLGSLEKTLAAKMLSALEAVVDATVDGRIEGWRKEKPNDLEGQRIYLEVLRELSSLIKEQNAGALKRG